LIFFYICVFNVIAIYHFSKTLQNISFFFLDRPKNWPFNSLFPFFFLVTFFPLPYFLLICLSFSFSFSLFYVEMWKIKIFSLALTGQLFVFAMKESYVIAVLDSCYDLAMRLNKIILQFDIKFRMLYDLIQQSLKILFMPLHNLSSNFAFSSFIFIFFPHFIIKNCFHSSGRVYSLFYCDFWVNISKW